MNNPVFQWSEGSEKITKQEGQAYHQESDHNGHEGPGPPAVGPAAAQLQLGPAAAQLQLGPLGVH